MTSTLFQGIDLAKTTKNIGYCIIADDGNTLTVHAIGDEANVPIKYITRLAIDCHFGYPIDIIKLLNGTLPSIEAQKSKQFALWRKTEDWFADTQFPRYSTKSVWDSRIKHQSEELSGSYFNKGCHIVPATGMHVIPRCLALIMGACDGDVLGTEGISQLRAAHRGESNIVESHPRLFMYSLLERIHVQNSLSAIQLGNAAKYKQRKSTKVRNRKRRESIVHLLVKYCDKAISRTLNVPDVMLLSDSDHHFDAFLSAMTAWSHHHNLTTTWQEAKIPSDVVDQEGHISILRTDICD